AGEERDQQALHDGVLADDGPGDLRGDALGEAVGGAGELRAGAGGVDAVDRRGRGVGLGCHATFVLSFAAIRSRGFFVGGGGYFFVGSSLVGSAFGGSLLGASFGGSALAGWSPLGASLGGSGVAILW